MAGVSQGAGIGELLLSVTYFQEVDEVSEDPMANDRGGRFPAGFDRAAKGVDPVGGRRGQQSAHLAGERLNKD